MRDEFDFSRAKRAKDVPHLAALQAANNGKTRITIMLDSDVIETFRKRAEAAGRGYQTLINEALKAAATADAAPVTLKSLRRVLREELAHAAA